MEDCRVVELRHRGEPAEFPGELHKGRFCRLRAKAQAANSITVKEDLFDSSFFGGPFIFKGPLFC